MRPYIVIVVVKGEIGLTSTFASEEYTVATQE